MHFTKTGYLGPVHAVELSHCGRFIIAGLGPFLVVLHQRTGALLLHEHLYPSPSPATPQKSKLAVVSIPYALSSHEDKKPFERTGAGFQIKRIKLLHGSQTDLGQDAAEHQDSSTVFISFAVIGGKRVKLVQLTLCDGAEPSALLTHVVDLGVTKDWVMDVAFLDSDDQLQSSNGAFHGRRLAIGYAHNFVETVQVEDAPATDTPLHRFATYRVLRAANGHHKCLLYSLSFYGNTEDSLVIASGTIFNQVVIWDLRLKFDRPYAIVLKGHDGSIFHVEWGKDGKSLASTSDDRTVRFWRLSEHPLQSQEIALVQQAQNGNTKDMQDSIIMYGHVSRVWKCLLLHDFLVSAGEDATVRIWSYSGECLNTFRGHANRSVWSIATNETEDIVVSGGGDSCVKSWSLGAVRAVLQGKNRQEFTLPTATDPKQFSSKSEYVRNLRTHKQLLYVASNLGYVFEINTETGNIRTVFNLREYSGSDKASTYIVCIALSQCGQFMTVGDMRGTCLLLETATGKVLATIKTGFNKCISDIEWLFPNKEDTSQSVLVLGAPDGQTRIVHLPLSLLASQQVEHDVLSEQISQLPCAHIKLNSKITCVSLVSSKDILLLGDLHGSLYSFQSFSSLHQRTSVTADFVIPKAHIKEKVSDMIYLEESVYGNSKVLTVGRDGMLNVFSLAASGELQSLNSFRLLQSVPTAEKVFVDQNNSKDPKDWDVIVMGFHGPRLIVFNFTQQSRLMTVPCGSAKRIVDFMFDQQRSYMISFVMDRAIHVVQDAVVLQRLQDASAGNASNRSYLSTFHGREVYDCVSFTSPLTGKVRLITTSEDTSAKITEVDTTGASAGDIPLKVVQQLVLHETVTRVVSVHTVSQDEETATYDLFVAGGKEQLSLWRLTETKSGDITEAKVMLNCYLLLQFLDVFHPEISSSSKSPVPFSEQPSVNHSVGSPADEGYADEENDEEGEEEDEGGALSGDENDATDENHTLETVVAGAKRKGYTSRDDARRRKRLAKRAKKTSISFRVMSIASFKIKGQSQSYCLAIGSSDACLKIFIVECQQDGSAATITPVGFFRGDRGPILSMSLATLDNGSQILCAGNTGGEILVFDLTRYDSVSEDDPMGRLPFLIQPIDRIRAHQSGVNSLCAKALPGNRVCVFSGGDDQSVFYVDFDVASRQASNKRTANCTARHSSAVNGASIVPMDNRMFCVSASVDQRLNVFTVDEQQEGTLALTLRGSAPLDVSEPSTLETHLLDSSNRVLAAITGIGMQTIEINFDQ